MTREEKFGQMLADDQERWLAQAIKALHCFTSYAEKDSRFAVPAEVDNVKELLEEVYELMYPGEM